MNSTDLWRFNTAVLPHDEGTPFEEYWNEDEWKKKEAILHKRDGEYYLHVAVEKEVDLY